MQAELDSRVFQHASFRRLDISIARVLDAPSHRNLCGLIGSYTLSNLAMAALLVALLALCTPAAALAPGSTVTVIGASGNVGKLVALRLSETFKVRGVVRSKARARLLECRAPAVRRGALPLPSCLVCTNQSIRTDFDVKERLGREQMDMSSLRKLA